MLTLRVIVPGRFLYRNDPQGFVMLCSLVRIGTQYSGMDQAPGKQWRKPYLFSIEDQARKEMMKS